MWNEESVFKVTVIKPQFSAKKKNKQKSFSP